MLPCVFKAAFGIECPGCGIQRSALLLLRGDLLGSLLMYPALIPLVLMVLFLGYHLVVGVRRGDLVLKYMFILNSVLIFGGYILRHIFH